MSVKNHFLMLFKPTSAIAALLLMSIVGSKAQTVLWELSPTDAYTKIDPFTSGLFQVKDQAGKMGYIDAVGKIVVPIENDAVTGFYDGKALLLCQEGERQRINGYLTIEGRYQPFTTAFYTLDGQEFFSEGMLTVEDEKGYKGYIDLQGRKVFGFTKKYHYIKPFHEGYAAVCIDEYRGVPLFFPYDKKGIPLELASNPPEQGDYTMTNFDQGLAYALFANSNSKVYSYSKEGQWKLFSTDGFNAPDDFLYRYGRNEDISYQSMPQPVPDTEVQLTSSNQLYGFLLNNGKPLLPCQFTAATPFADHLSVVHLQGRIGILRYAPTSSPFTLSTPQQPIDYYAGQSVNCAFTLSVPSEWNNQGLHLTLSDGEQTVYNSEGGGNHQFVVSPQAPFQSYQLHVKAGDLLLWSDSASYTFNKLYYPLGVTISIPEENDRKNYYVALDNENNIPVLITVSNPNDEELSVTISATGSSTFVAPRATTATIGAHKSATVTAHFHVEKRQHTEQSVSVTVTLPSVPDVHSTLGPLELRSNF